jgi:murein DD-endopeptidase MepM/ murein hydrolase activator NlpD
MPFPLPFLPTQSYRTGGRRFGADRDNGRRKHAGCDLIAPVGTPIFAIDDGVVMEAAEREFYRGTFAVVIQHGGYVARYCEIKSVAQGMRRGRVVTAGTVIAFVGAHTNRQNTPYQRRADLLNPTPILDRLAHHVLQSHESVVPTTS